VVSSGTTAKQLARETDAVRIGYGGMLLEGLLALVALSAVMICAQGDDALGRHPTAVFANGLGRFMGALGIPESFGFKFGLLAISTFLLTTLDTGTRLARYVFEELAGRRDVAMRLLANTITLALPVILLNLEVTSGGKAVPAYKLIWPMFGATNQLLGGLALLTVTVWLKKTGRKAWFVMVPMIFMIGITLTALVELIIRAARSDEGLTSTANAVQSGYTAVLLVLALFLVAEAVRALRPVRS
jgi:carbon starvation protein